MWECVKASRLTTIAHNEVIVTNRSSSLDYALDKFLKLRTRILGDLFLESKLKANKLKWFSILMLIKSNALFCQEFDPSRVRESTSTLAVSSTAFMWSCSTFSLFGFFGGQIGIRPALVYGLFMTIHDLDITTYGSCIERHDFKATRPRFSTSLPKCIICMKMGSYHPPFLY